MLVVKDNYCLAITVVPCSALQLHSLAESYAYGKYFCQLYLNIGGDAMSHIRNRKLCLGFHAKILSGP
jgi:hypothetical protein